MKKIITVISFLLSCIIVVAQPANDEACGAINIAVENTGCEPTTVYNYTGATFSSTSGNQYCINPSNNLDVWYKFTVPASGEAAVSIASADGLGYIAEVYSSTSCNAVTILNQSTNGFPCLFSGTGSSSPSSQKYRNLVPGSTAYIRVLRYYGTGPQYANGSIKICVSNPAGLSDEPCNAGFIDITSADPLAQNCEPANEYFISNATLTPAVPNPSCLYSGYYPLIRDVWFKVKVPASGKLNVGIRSSGIYTSSNWFIVTYTATACNSGFTEIGCAQWDGVSGNPILRTSTFTNLVPNTVLYCRLVPNSSAAQPNGQVKICVSEYNSIPPVNNSANVGIGIDTPFAKLDVVGTGIFRDKVTTATDLEVRGNLIVKGNILGKYGPTVIQGNTSIQGGSVTIDSLDMGSRLGNRVALYGGLGNSPKYGIGIQSSLMQLFTDTYNASIAFGYGNSYGFAERARIINQGEMGMSLTGRLQLRTGTNSAGHWLMNTANTANVAFIGLASDNQVGFHGTGGAGWGLTMNTANANVGIGLNGAQPLRPLSFPATLGEKILLYPGGTGEVGIGVYGNELRLHADNSNAKVSFGTQTNAGVYTENAKAERNGNYAFSVFGSLWVNGTTYASDERFKQNIKPIASALHKLLQIKGVEYEMKDKEFEKLHFTRGRQIGLLAQNVEQVVPEAVQEMDGYKGVDYAKLVPLLIESIRELKQKITELENRLNTSTP